MHEKNIALLCDEADRLLQLNINLLRQMVEEPDVLSDSKNENRLLFDKQKALKRIEELEGEQIKTARREMVLAVVGTMKAGKSTTINAIVGQEILPNRNRPMTSVPTLIRHVPGKTEPVLHLEHIQPVRNLLITLQEKLATPAGQQVAQTLQQTGDNDDDETWVLFNAMNGNRAEMSPEAAGIAACLMTYSHHACRTENYAMTVHYYRLRDYALQHPECSAIMRIID